MRKTIYYFFVALLLAAAAGSTSVSSEKQIQHPSSAGVIEITSPHFLQVPQKIKYEEKYEKEFNWTN